MSHDVADTGFKIQDVRMEMEGETRANALLVFGFANPPTRQADVLRRRAIAWIRAKDKGGVG